MANVIQTKYDASSAFTLTLASLANAAGRQSTIVDNSNNRPGALIFVRIKSGGSAPTAGKAYRVYLIRADAAVASDNLKDDGAGDSDGAFTPENATLLGTIVVTASTAKNFYGVFDTGPLGPLGPAFGIAVYNDSGQTISSTESDHAYRYVTYYPEIQ